MASPQTENGYTRIANELYEAILGYELPRNTGDTPLRLIFFVIRKTYGYGKTSDAISLTQFERGIKARRATIVYWLNYLVRANVLVRGEKVSKNGVIYGINKDYESWLSVVRATELVRGRAVTSTLASTRTSSMASTHKRKKEKTKEIDDKSSSPSKPKKRANKLSRLMVDEFIDWLGGTPDGDYKLKNLYPTNHLAKKIWADVGDGGDVDNDVVVKQFRGILDRMDNFHRKNATSVDYVYRHYQKITNTLK